LIPSSRCQRIILLIKGKARAVNMILISNSACEPLRSERVVLGSEGRLSGLKVYVLFGLAVENIRREGYLFSLPHYGVDPLCTVVGSIL